MVYGTDWHILFVNADSIGWLQNREDNLQQVVT